MIRLAAALLLCGACAFAQPAAAQLTFEVATVKPAAQADLQGRWGESYPMPMLGGPGTSSPGEIMFRNASLMTILTAAFGVKRYQMSGPAWLQTTGFSIVAKVPSGATHEQIKPMLQNLLLERFRLAAHREMKETPVYALSIAKGGPRLKPSLDPDEGGAFGTWKGNPRWQAANQTGANIAAFLSPLLDRPVIDMTGLTGKYGFTLYWTAEYPMVRMGPSNLASEAPDPAPTLFQALQDQLGLTLKPRKFPIDLIVIDRIEKTPVDN